MCIFLPLEFWVVMLLSLKFLAVKDFYTVGRQAVVNNVV
jgi:hypothetical protein